MIKEACLAARTFPSYPWHTYFGFKVVLFVFNFTLILGLGNFDKISWWDMGVDCKESYTALNGSLKFHVRLYMLLFMLFYIEIVSFLSFWLKLQKTPYNIWKHPYMVQMNLKN